MKCTRIDEELSRPLRTTDLTFVQLVDEARSLLLFEQEYQRPAERKEASMRAASEGGLLVKPAHLRSVAESNDKGRHLASALEIPFPQEEDRYRIPANCVHEVDYILSADVATLAKQRQSQVKCFRKIGSEVSELG